MCQGKSNDCGPFSAAIAINAVTASHVDPKRLARDLERPRWIGPLPRLRRIPRWATFPWGVADALREHGLRAGWRFLSTTGRLQRGLAAGELLMPIYGGWRRRPWAHVVVLVAHDPERGWGLVDPQHKRAEIVWMTEERFRRRWRCWGNLLVTATPPPDLAHTI